MNPLLEQEPRRVWAHFTKLCSIPHGSGNMGPASRMCMEFAAAHGLECRTDEAQNVIISKPATPGYEKAEPVMLQGHLDMVCEQEPGRGFDFLTDGLELCVDGDWLSARGTTLGGDDGIAVAMMLAVLEADDLPHPALECVFTTDEETGMGGARALDFSRLKSRRLINLDSEEEGVFTVCCAGGIRVQCQLPVLREPFDGAAFRVTVGGLLGGHSGGEIDKGRGSAHQLLGRLLGLLQEEADFRLTALQGGARDNVICPLASAELVLAEADVPTLERLAEACRAMFREELAVTDPGVAVTLERLDTPSALPLTKKSTDEIVWLLLVSPQGIEAMSADFPGLVRTSLNLGILHLDADALHAGYLLRSALVSEKQMLVQRMQALLSRLDCKVTLVGSYHPWEYRRDSALRETAVQAFRELFGKEPVVAGTHGGLECGLFCGKLPELDAISFGPELHDIHSPRERLSISSTERTWRLLCRTLRLCR
ncbi:MAG: beta-Ala-His dipeptidase [Clostridiales bacterium]|nr:beta-Ala-His dipeptidase [Clostridiales bacterium]